MKRGCISSTTENTSSESSTRGRNIPLSLGKLSLRKRLEDYYSLVAPDTIANEMEWKQKFDQIFSKYGGSEKGEFELMTKLCKKYGPTVRLMLAKSAPVASHVQKQIKSASGTKMDESSYQIPSEYRNSGVLDFTSDQFDPYAALGKDFVQVSEVNPFLRDSKYLDNISKFIPYLPTCDPLYRPPPERKVNNLLSSNKDGNGILSADVMKKKIPVFTSLASYHQSGPISFLYTAHLKRERIRVLIRYVDCIRGTLTGFLIAFDKHFNLLLRDVDEVFTNRMTQVKHDYGTENCSKSSSNLEVEIERRRLLMNDKGTFSTNVSDTLKVGKRHFQQLLVRGDNIVSVWKAEAEK